MYLLKVFEIVVELQLLQLTYNYYYFKNQGFYYLGYFLRYENLNILFTFKKINYNIMCISLYLFFEITKLTNINKLLNKWFSKLNKRFRIRNTLYTHYSPINNYEIAFQANILRQFWCKTYKGKCHLKGKPVHSQNTWSNGWTSYKKNLLIRKHVYLYRLKKLKKKKYLLLKKKVLSKRYNKLFSVPKPIKKKPIKKKPIKKKKFDVWS